MSDTSSDWARLARELATPHAGLALTDLAAGAVTLDAETVARWKGAEIERSEARVLREALVRWLREKNQFVAIDEGTEGEIEDALMRLVSEIGEGDLSDAQDALDDALDGLASVVRQSLGQAPREVVVSEYTPELQLAALSLPLGAITSPVLDIGCGAQALLPRYLRNLGHDVIGIDRDAGSDAERADWLTYEYGTAKWRTIISHLGFTLHFLRAHLASEDEARKYAETFLRITRSLVIGGKLVYAPSVPFFESVLPPGRFLVERHAVRGGETLESLRKSSGLDLAQATHLTRLA